jgi:hypothetical protein
MRLSQHRELPHLPRVEARAAGRHLVEAPVHEPAEDPVGQASTKVVQYVSLVTMAAEALAQRRQQQAAAAAAVDERAAAALRMQQTSAHAAARLHWQPMLDPRRRDSLNLPDTALAWAGAQAWLDSDPEAALACLRAEERLRQLRPDVMQRFTRLTQDGVDQLEAMRRVAPFFDRPPAREHPGPVRPALRELDAPVLAAAGSVTRTGDDGLGLPARSATGLDDPDTDRVGQGQEASESAVAYRQQTDALHTDGVRLPAAGPSPARGTTAAPVLEASVRTPPEVARDGYPEPLTGQVLAGGRVKPKTPDRTAPAAMRSTSLATAARATSGRSR